MKDPVNHVQLDILAIISLNMALNLLLEGKSGRLVALRDGKYKDVELKEIAASKKRVNLKKHYHTERLRPDYQNFENKPLFIMSCED